MVAAKPGNIDGIAFMVDPCPAEGFFFSAKIPGDRLFSGFFKVGLGSSEFFGISCKSNIRRSGQW